MSIGINLGENEKYAPAPVVADDLRMVTLVVTDTLRTLTKHVFAVFQTPDACARCGDVLIEDELHHCTTCAWLERMGASTDPRPLFQGRD